MKKHFLHKKSLLSAVLFVLFVSIIGLTSADAQTFTVGNLNYSLNSDGATVTLTGHVDGTAATGELVIPESIELYGTAFPVTIIEASAFRNCTGLIGSLTIPNSVTSIGYSAFYNCSGFTGSLTIGNSVTSIGDNAFYYCSGFTGSLTIGNSVTSIGNYAFYYCSGFTGSLTIGNSVTSMGYSPFRGCSGFTSLNYNATTYGKAFYSGSDHWLYGCINITTVTIGDNVQVIPSRFLDNKTSITGSLTIPNSVTSIGSYAFNGCSGFTGSLTIPNSVTSIESYAFNGCSGFTGSLTLGNSVTSIGEKAFYNCSGLTGSLTIPSYVTTIGINAFSGCSSLSGTLTIGHAVASIGNTAFFGACEGFTNYKVLPENPPTLGTNVFVSANYAAPLSVHCGSVEDYQNANGWNVFTNIQEIDPCDWMITTSIGEIMSYGGTITSGGGSYEQGQICTLVAAPNEGFVVYWTENGEVVSTDATYSFTVTSDRHLVANFTYDYSVYIGNGGNETSYYIPTRGNYNYSLSQQIYSAEEIGVTGEINRIALFTTHGVQTRNLDIYLAYTAKTRFNSGNDWIAMTEENRVFSGDVTMILNDWTTITLDTPFLYDGTCNIVFVVDDNSGSIGSPLTYFKTFNSSTYQSIYRVDDNNNLNPINPFSYGGNTSYTRNQVIFGFASPFSYAISLNANPSNGGTVTGAGAYEMGQSCTITATPSDSYLFVNWTKGGEVVSTDASYTFTVTGNETYTANFTYDTSTYIEFADANVKALCVANWDTNGDGELSYNEAAAVTDLGEVFPHNYSIQTFDELQYFTGLTTIGYEAFAWCHGLQSITIPTSVTNIGLAAFYDCINMLSITIPASVTSIGSSALAGCDKMETMVVEAGNTVYDSRNNCNGIIETATNTLIAGCKNTVIPNTVTSIDRAFSLCGGITAINIPYSVTYISSIAFYACSALSEITVDASNPVYDSRDNCNAIIQTATNQLIAGSKTTVIPNSVTSIGEYALSYRFGSGTYNIEIPSQVSSIGQSAYLGGYGIASITSYVKTPPTLGTDVFEYVNKSIPVYVPAGTVPAYKSAYGWSEFTNIREIGTHWSPISGTENNMVVNGVIVIDGEQQYNPLLEVGAFCGDECRGSSFARYFPPTGEYVVSLTVVSNETEGETISFRLYDHEQNAEADVVSFKTIEFVADGEIGTDGVWYEYVFYRRDNLQNVSFVEGWNWWSTYIEQNNYNGLEILEDSLGHKGSVIKNQTQALVNYYPQYGNEDVWFGDMTALENENCYLIKTTSECEFLYTGIMAIPSDHPITLTPNWTWIGYPVNLQQYPSAAMSGFTPAQNDIVKSHNAFAFYYNGSWFPENFAMIPGQGYKYQSKANYNKTLTFVNHGEKAELVRENRYWKSNEHAFADNMNVIATVYVADMEQRDADLELGAFVNGVCRGSAKLKYFEPLNRYYAMLTVLGETDENLEFALVNAEMNKMGNNSDESITFAADAVIGTLDEPLEIHFGEMTEIDRSRLFIYPNPVDRNEAFTLDLPKDEAIKEIIITDALGAVVCKNTDGLRISGVYVVKAVCVSGNVYIGKLIVK